MPVVEDDAHGIAAHRFEPADPHIALAPDQLLLTGAMALDLGTGTLHPQILRRQRHLFARVEADVQCGAVGREPQLIWPGLTHG